MKSRGLVRAAVWGTAAVLAVRVANAQDTTGTVPTTDPAPTDVVIVTEPTEPTEPVPLTGPQSVPQNRIANEFRPLLGNDAEAVVSGLRTGDAITLTETTPGTLPGDPPEVTTVTIDSPTGPLGNGEVSHTLDLARFQLAQAGITEPTASELQAALTGGSVTNGDGVVTDMQGVLTMRADGMGWGRIAHEMGTTLGAIKNGTAVAMPPAAPAPTGSATGSTSSGGSTLGDDAATATTTAASHGREHGIVNATGESVASIPSGAHGGGKGRDAGITDALGASSAGHGRSDSQVTNALGESSSLHGPGRGQGIVDGLGAGSDGGAKHVVNAMGSSNGGGHGVGAGIVDGLGASTDGGRGAAAVTDALGNSGGGGGFGGSHGGGNGGGNGGGHGRGGH